ncbi:MAG: cytochrome c1 [Legionella sp.]|uniref:cytochrome c1 n=1 Tax=Legionella sp. TaxID=459 RepID=UPI0039E28EFC
MKINRARYYISLYAWFSSLLLLFVSQEVFAQYLKIDLHDKTSLQRGARSFMNYCSGCHSLKYLRYNRMAEGLGLFVNGHLDEDLLKNNLIFTQAAINDPIRIALPPEDARQWFGVIPNDLSLIARSKGIDWLYAYLQGFYEDNSRPFGTNNLLVPGVAMPNILGPLIGEKVLILQSKEQAGHLLMVSKGELSPQEMDRFLQDLVTFLAYVAEPTKIERQQIGPPVMSLLLILGLVMLCLKRIYWRKIPKL